MARTRAQSEARVRVKLGDPNNKVWPDDGRILAWLKEAYDDFAYRTKTIFRRAAIADVAGTATYSLPSDFQVLQRCEWNNILCTPVRGYDLSVSDKAFETTQGDVFAYMIDGDGTRTLRKIRVPSANHATKFQIEYYAKGAALSTSATTFEVPDWMIDIIENKVLHFAYDAEGPGQSIELSMMYLEEYERGVQRILDRRQRIFKMHRPVIGGGANRPAIGRPVNPPNYGRPTRS